MRICVSSTGKEKDSMSNQRFGRCDYFAIIDTETEEFKSIENTAKDSMQGAGVAAGQKVVDEKVEVVITGHLGPKAMKVLQASNIKGYKCMGVSIEEEVNLLKEGKLEEIVGPGALHAGMEHGHRMGR